MDGRIVSQGVLVVSAVRRTDGLREILAVEVADTESEATYQEMFRSLKSRGLRGVELVVSDDHEGLKAAVGRHFQGASTKGARSTTVGTFSGMVGCAKRKELASDLRVIFAAPERDQAMDVASSVARSGKRRATRRSLATLRST